MTLIWSSTTDQLYAAGNSSPSLDLDFATTKTLDDQISGQNLITFSRSTTGTYVDSNGLIQTAAIDEARFDHNPVTGESLGLLIEESRTNLVTYSEEFDNAAWVKARTTITANAATAPDGTATADKLIRNTDNAVPNVVYQSVSLSQATYTFSVYAKKGEYDFCTLNLPGGNGWAADFWISVDLTDGSFTTSASAPTSTSVVAYPNGWYRISIAHAANAAVTRSGYIAARSSAGYGAQAGDGTSGIYVWGAQLEEGSFPTSYIPTSGSTVTRAADVAEITGSNFSGWYNQSEGTVFVEDKANASDSYPMACVLQNTTNLSDGSMSNYLSPSGRWVFDSRNNGGDFDLSLPNVSGSFVRRSAGLKDNDLALALNGAITTTGTGSITASTSILYIGQRPPSYNYNGHIKRLTYYPYRLGDTKLQEITS